MWPPHREKRRCRERAEMEVAMLPLPYETASIILFFMFFSFEESL